MQKKLFLLDAFALIFRSYYALVRNPRYTSKGKNTNAQFGFTNTLVELINKEKPTHIAVCFDVSGPTERHIEYEAYKANRQETPEDLLAAVPDIKRIIEGFNIPVIGMAGYEADDVIGTLAWQAHDAGFEVFMVTPDKDYGQLVRDGVYMYKPASQGGDVTIMGIKEVCEKWDIQHISQVVDMLGLMGDAVDNIPGIKGVGEKTAAKLLKEYGTLENVLDNAEKIKGSIGEKVRADKANALLSKKLATIITNVPVRFDESSFLLTEMNREGLNSIFSELEFRTIGKRILGDSFSATATPSESSSTNQQTDLFGNVVASKSIQPIKEISDREESVLPTNFKTIKDTNPNYILINEADEITSLINELKLQKELCFDTETTSLNIHELELVGLSFSYEAGKAFYVPCTENKKEVIALLQQFKPLFDDEQITWIGQNIKFDLLVLNEYNISIKGKYFDTMLAHYVIDPEGKRSMDLLSMQYLQYQPVSIEELIGKKGKNQGTMRTVALETIKDYAAEDADITYQLKQHFAPLLSELNVEKVFNEVEIPLLNVLTAMEQEGVKIDEAFLNDYSRQLEIEANEAEQKVYATAGVRFNLASPKQLGEVLFDKLLLDSSAKKTKTGQYQTGEDVLQKLANKGHEIANDIITFRELTKLKSTYVDALPLMISKKTGRVHTSYAQAVAVTGRLSSNNPNLQNIPIRTAKGKEIRKAFIPRDENRIIVSADYSQIELRIIAAISGDPNMCAAFKEGIDIHTATAAKVYNISTDEVTKEMRYKAKSVNFGIIYGQGAFGLAENLGISRTEAKEIIDNYKREFVGISNYMANTIAEAQKQGYVTTLMGRKRWLKDINSANFTVRGFAERNAINSPIQGTAADMIKLAMIKVHHAIKDACLKSVMIMQVHDELVFDVVKEELETIKPIILKGMQEALILPNNVPVVAEMGFGNNWLEAH